MEKKYKGYMGQVGLTSLAPQQRAGQSGSHDPTHNGYEFIFLDPFQKRIWFGLGLTVQALHIDPILFDPTRLNCHPYM